MLEFLSRAAFSASVVLIASAMALVYAGINMTGQAMAVNTVSMGDNFFAPQSIIITAGSAIEWKNDGVLPHTATSDSGLFDTGILKKTQSASQVFNTPGTYPYFCEVHPEMTGTVIVEGAAPEPTPPPAADPGQQPPAADPQPDSQQPPPAADQPAADNQPGQGGGQLTSAPGAGAQAVAGLATFPNGGGPPLPRADMFRGAALLMVLGLALFGGGIGAMVMAGRQGAGA